MLRKSYMEQHTAKRRKAAVEKLLKEKAQNLPLLCVETIFKFTPTSKLVRLYSKSVPLPGAFWNFGLKAVLKKRLPLSISEVAPYHKAGVPAALCDATGAKVASIKQPEAFRFSPLCELVQSAVLSVHAVLPRWINYNDRMYLCVVNGEALLSHLPKVSELTLMIRYVLSNREMQPGDLLELSVKHLVPQLRSFEIHISNRLTCWSEGDLLSNALNDCMCEMLISHEMACLRRLVLPSATFTDVRLALSDAAVHAGAERAFAGLNSLGLGRYNAIPSLSWPLAVRATELALVTTSFRRLSQLQLVVRDEFGPYMAAFRAMPGLTSLGLYLAQLNPDGIDLGDTAVVSSVLDLRMICVLDSTAVAIASRFPNAKSFAFQQSREDSDPLDLVSDFLAAKVLPNVDKLSCFSSPLRSVRSSVLLTQFLADAQLPEAVDLSQIVFENLARDSGALTALYDAVQDSAVKRLLMRGPVHRDSVAYLQNYADFHGETVKVTAWKDRDVGEQPGLANLTELSSLTDLKIVGRKITPGLEGEQFVIRVIHQLTKHTSIFD